MDFEPRRNKMFKGMLSVRERTIDINHLGEFLFSTRALQKLQAVLEKD